MAASKTESMEKNELFVRRLRKRKKWATTETSSSAALVSCFMLPNRRSQVRRQQQPIRLSKSTTKIGLGG
eukprot:1862685-Rhodomonas_salina.1